jgi:hypothetical protein
LQKLLLTTALAGLLAGCADTNTGLNNLQFSGDSQAFPANYRDVAAHAMAGIPVAAGKTLEVSYPQPLLGTTATDPKRWYVCVRGLATPVTTGIYEAIVIINAPYPPAVTEAFDAALCKTGTYAPLPPLPTT